MGKKKKLEQFISEFYKTYPNFEIINLLKISGEIIVKDSDGFLYKKNPATSVLKNKLSIDSVIDKVEFLNFKLKKLFPNLTILEYHGMRNKCLVKDENNFHYKPVCYDLIKGHPVTIQTCLEKEKLFEYKSNLKHNNLYVYPKFIYKNGKQKIKIKCKLHGEFEQMIESHLFGYGCTRCASIGFSKTSWLKRLKNKIGTFYIIKMFNDDEIFLKIGITSKTVISRYKNLKVYNYEIIKEINGSPSEIYDLEKNILKIHKKEKYVPKYDFNGNSECFNIEILNKLKEYV